MDRTEPSVRMGNKRGWSPKKKLTNRGRKEVRGFSIKANEKKGRIEKKGLVFLGEDSLCKKAVFTKRKGG